LLQVHGQPLLAQHKFNTWWLQVVVAVVVGWAVAVALAASVLLQVYL
jgi:hypothetical protein